MSFKYDSLGKCNLYDNPYNVKAQSRPELVKLRQTIYTESQDTLGVHQAKLEKQLLQILQQKALTIGSGPFIILGKLGKFAFLAFTLPPYLFLYGMPKWLMAKTAPHLFKFAKAISTKISKGVRQLTNTAFSLVAGTVRVVTDPILNFIQTRIEKTREFYHQTGALLRKIARSIAMPFIFAQKGINEIRQFNKKIAKAFHQLRDKIPSFTFKMPALPKFKSLNFAQYIPSISLPSFERGKKLVEFTKKGLSNLGTHLKKGRERAVESIIKRFEPVSQWFENLPKIFKKQINRSTAHVGKIVEKARVKIKERVLALSERTVDAAKKFGETTVFVAKEIVSILPPPLVNFFIPIVAGIAWTIKAPFQLFNDRSKIRAKLQEKARKVGVFFLAMNNSAKSLLQRGARWLWPKIVASPRKMLSLLKKGALISKEVLKSAFYLLRLIWAWIRVLFRYAFILLRQSFAELLAN